MAIRFTDEVDETILDETPEAITSGVPEPTPTVEPPQGFQSKIRFTDQEPSAPTTPTEAEPTIAQGAMQAGEFLVEQIVPTARFAPKLEDLGGIANAAANAFDSSRQAMAAINGVTPEEAQEISRLEYQKSARELSPAYSEYLQAEGMDAVKSFLKNPIEITANIAAEGLAGSVYSLGSGLATGAAGAAVGSVVPVVGTTVGFVGGQVVGTFGGSLATEYGGKILEELQTAGMDLKDPESIQKFFGDEKLMEEARSQALKRGVPVAIFDAVSAGIGGRIARIPFTKALTKTATREALTEAGAQAALGGGGEVAGALAAGEEIQPKAVFGEVIGEVGTGAVEVATGKLTTRRPQTPEEKKFTETVVDTQLATRQAQDIAPATADTVERQVNEILGETETPDQRVERLRREAEAGAEIELEEETATRFFESARNVISPQIRQIDPEVFRTEFATIESRIAENAFTIADLDQTQFKSILSPESYTQISALFEEDPLLATQTLKRVIDEELGVGGGGGGEGEPPVSGLPPVEPTPAVTPPVEAAVAPVEPVVAAEGVQPPVAPEPAVEVDPAIAAQKAIAASEISGRTLGINKANQGVEQAREVAYNAKQEASTPKVPLERALQVWEAAGDETKYGEPEFAAGELRFAVSGGYDKATNEVKLSNNPKEFSALTGDAALTPRSVVRHELGHWALFNQANNDLVGRLFTWADAADRTQILDPWHGGKAGVAYPKAKFDSRDELVSEAYSIWKSGGNVPQEVVPMLQELDALVPQNIQDRALQFADEHSAKLSATEAAPVTPTPVTPTPVTPEVSPEAVQAAEQKATQDFAQDLYGQEPYINHLRRVSEQMPNDKLKTAAFIHDSVEDGKMTLDEVRSQFGDDVAELVDVVSRKEGETYAQFIDRIAQNPEAAQIKLADLRENIRNVEDFKPSLRSRYEKAIAVLEPVVAQVAATPEVPTAEQGTGAFNEFIREELQRQVDEQRGQQVLDTMEQAGESPRAVVENFYRNIYDNLTPDVRARFDKYVERLGWSVPATMDSSPKSIGMEGAIDLGNDVQALEGIERGFVALARTANDLYAQRPEVTPTPELPPPTAVEPPALAPLRRVVKAEQTEEDVSGLVGQGLVELYKGQPVITQAGLEALPEAERPRLTPEARKIQIDTRTSEAAAEAISKNLRIGVDQVPVDVRMPAGWTIEGDIYIPPVVEAAPEVVRPEVAKPEQGVTPPTLKTKYTDSNLEGISLPRTSGQSNQARQALEAIAKGNSPYAQLAQEIINAANTNPEISFAISNSKFTRSTPEQDRGRFKGRSFYESAYRTISMNPKQAGDTRIALHEIIHAIIAHKLPNKISSTKLKGKKYKKALEEAVADQTLPKPLRDIIRGYVITVEKMGADETLWGSGPDAGVTSQTLNVSVKYLGAPIGAQTKAQREGGRSYRINKKSNVQKLLRYLKENGITEVDVKQGFYGRGGRAHYDVIIANSDLEKIAVEKKQQGKHPSYYGNKGYDPTNNSLTWNIKNKIFPVANDPDAVVEYGFEYGLGNIDEFLSEALSNPEFQKALNEIEMEGGKTVWQTIIDAIARILGMEVKAGSVLDVISRSTLELATEGDLLLGGGRTPTPSPAPEARESRRAIVTPQQDRDYLDAAERGDLDSAQAIVDQVAKDSGYQVLPLFHGTEADTIKKFRKKLSGIWLAFKKEAASPSSGERPTTIINAYADLGDNPITLTDEQAKEWQRSGSPLKWMRDFRLENRATAVIIGDYATVVFQPSQVKSADPVTRDDQGNIIPPSQRFQQGEADIRYARTERDPEVQKAAQDLKAGTIDRDEYQRIVDMRMPLRKFEAVPTPANNDDMLRGLGERKAGERLKKDLIQNPEVIAEGTVLESRLDIPAYENENVWVVSLHEPRPNINKGNAGPVVAYTPTSVLRNVEFGVTEKAAVGIAAGKPKSTIATMKGEYVPMTAEQAYELATTNKEQWVEIGMNPVRHSYFYDKDTQTPVVSAEEVVQVGGMVLAKNPVFGKREDYLYSLAEAAPTVGMTTDAVRARLEALGFGVEGMIRIVEDPQAAFEGRTIIQDGKAVRIELNASALNDDAAIDRVLNHEFAEAANADGALNKLVERLTPKEKKEINDAITRLGYEERVRTTEESARAIETLAAGWKGRGFFERAVARVEAWGSKLGLKLTRRAAEYIAARNLAEVSESVRKWHISDALANLNGARRVTFNGMSAVLIPPSEMQVAYSIAAYHGTPHEIKGRIKISRIGTGEGAAAFGWGLYFAENPEVAEQYRVGRLGTQYAFSYKGVPIYKIEDDGQANAILKIIAGISKEDVVSDLESRLKRIEAENAREEIVSSFGKRVEYAKQIEESEIKQITMGNLYSVQLNVEPDELLDWDKTFNEQSPKVQNAIRNIITEKDFVDKYLANPAKPESKKTGELLYFYVQDALRGKKTERAASLRLLREGVKGIQYLDQQSRAATEGTRNYVIFDENVITITGRNGKPVEIRESRREPAPTFTEESPEAKTLSNLKASMEKVDGASEAKGGKPETQKVSEIAANWMEQGGDERALQDAIIENTNLSPVNAAKVAKVIAKQYDKQQQIAEAVLETEAGVTLEGLPEGMEIPKDVDPKNKRTVLQRVIDATTGVRVKPVILQVPEKTALKEQIRLKARETREAKKAQQETADAVVEAIKALELRGPMRAKQAQALAKRAAKVLWTSEKSMENFIAYAERVMANTNYDADLREAKAAQKRAKELSKRDSIAAPQRETLEAIGNIGINLLNDPREFADVVNHYLRSFKPVVSEAYVVVPDAEMKSYLSAAEDVVNGAKAEFEVEDNERLADKYGITIDELKKYMDAEEIMDALVKYAKREVIEGILNEKSAGVKEALKGVDTTILRADQRKLIDSMKVIDVKSLDAAEKQAYIRIGNNIIFNNNQTNGAEFFVATAKGQQSARDLAKNTEAMTKNKAWANIVPALGSRRAKKVLKAWAEDLQSVADTFRNAFGKEAMTVFYEAMGMVDLDLGFTNAARTLEEIQSKMEKFYKKLDKKYKGAATNQDGILSEGIVGYLIQNVPEKREADSLAQRRGLLQQDIAERRKSGDEDRMQMADRIQELMQKLDGDTVDQILSNLKREYPANYESLTWLKDELFPQYKDFLKQFDENFNDQANNYNTPNYLPIVYSNISPSIDLLQGKKKYYDNLSSAPKQSSYTIKRSDYTQLPLGDDGKKPKEIGLNLRRNAYNSLSDQITRAYTNPARQRIYSFLKTPESEEALGGAANRDFFAERIERLMESRERRGSFNKNAFEKAVDVLANLGRDIGTRIALAGSYQFIRQPADQVTVAIGVTGRADLMAKHLDPREIKSARPVIDLFSIGRRGDASSGYKYINQMEGAQSRLERYYTEGNWVKAKEAAKNFADKFMAPLKVSDFTVAAATWMTFYRAYLAKNGIRFTTWEDAANLIKSDDVGHKRAAAYAENMTDIYQGSSDPTKMAVFAQKGKTGPENLLKAILVPFNSFGVQFRSRISSELTEIFTRSGDWRGKAVAVKDLGATIGGTIMFGLAKRFVLPAITLGGVQILYSIFGIDVEEPDEEKKKEEFELKWRQLQGDIVSTMIVGGGGQMLESYTIDGMNYLKYMIDSANGSEDVLDDDGEVISFNKYAKERAPFYRYRSFDNAISLGILDIGMDQAKKSILNTKMVLTPEEMERFTPEEQRFLYVALISDWLYLGGFNDADFARMWDKGRRDMIKARKEEEKELQRIRSGR